ncbi:4Fe-4S binding protein, partial [Chloroflexota bacterium]
ESGLEPMVLGACSKLSTRLMLWETPERATIDPFSVRIVDLLREIGSHRDATALIERARLLLWAQVARQASFNTVPEQALKVHFNRPQGDIGRRDLFKTLLPRYQVIPYVRRDMCVGWESCQICRESCPCNAIVNEDDEVLIDKPKCRGCGSCVTVCPRQAVSYPTFSPDELAAEMEGLLVSDGDMLKPRIIAITCESRLSSFSDKGENLLVNAPNVLPLEVPCLDMASPWLLLRAFDLGAQGLAIISNKEMCQLGLGCNQWQDNVRFTQELLELWGMEGERVRSFDGNGLEQGLSEFARQVASMPSTCLTSSQPTAVPDGGPTLPALIASLTEKLAPLSIGVVSAGSVPLGKLVLDTSQCTACGLCALECPTGALIFPPDPDTGSCRLLFQHQSCVGCGQCVKVCPEDCLHLENVLELHSLNVPAETLLEAEIARCQKCGAAIAPKAMIDKLKAAISDGERVASYLDICPACRTRAVFGAAASKVGV